VTAPAASASAHNSGADSVGVGSLMSIGDVLAHLRDEFPDVTISKLRFLEAEGLVEPARTAAGYRKYTRDDVARLRYVLAAQREHYLPLRVIREHLSALDRGEALPDLNRAGLSVVSEPQPESTMRHAGEGGRWDRSALLRRSGLTDEVLTELEDAGLITARSPGWYDADALAVAEVAAAFAEYGLGPRHLRAYRAAADREVGMVTAVVAPMAKSATAAARARAAEAIRELTGLSQSLHAALVRVGLRDTLGP
jgi:DNA-binding transcriptional MerR regulator